MALADPVARYARQVLNGKILTGELVRLACARHRADLARWGLHPEPGNPHFFDRKAALHGLAWFKFLRHYKGEHAGKEFTLEPWEQFIVGSLFGWKRADSLRRFRNAWIEIGKKNGKTPLAAGLGLKLCIGDKEPGALVACAATKRDQARLVFNDMEAMAQQSPNLAPHLEFLANSIYHAKSRSRIETLSRDSRSQEGFDLHAAIIDEIHVHRDKKTYTTIKGAFAARRQPMLVIITTAGEDKASIGMELHRLSVYVLEGVVPDETWFAFIAAADDGDDWRDPKTWHKANPNLGVSVKLDFLEAECVRAQASPVLQADFRRYHCNEWVDAATTAVEKAAWARGAEPFDSAELEGRPCYGGLDLARVHDLTAFTLVFPPEDPDRQYTVLCWFWCPDDDILARSTTDAVPYNVWRDDGHILTTPGNVTDFGFIEKHIIDMASVFNIRELAFDRWEAEEVTQAIADAGVEVVAFGQGFKSMGPACDTLDWMLRGNRLAHGGHPVLTWNARNLRYATDPAGNHKPDKDESPERIDGMVALIMAAHRAHINAAGPNRPGVY